MTNDVAVFLDLDNLAIGAKQANMAFDIDIVLEAVKKNTNGRIVFRYACGAAQQNQGLLHDLSTAGFTLQSVTPVNSTHKNLADMHIVVTAMDTLVDGHLYDTYVLLSGDRDFTPLVQSLRKRGKRVIGVGVKHTTSSSLIELCDQYLFYEDIVPQTNIGPLDIENLLSAALNDVLKKKRRVRASILNQRMMDISKGIFDNNAYPESGFTRFLERFPELVTIEQDGSTIYVSKPYQDEERPLHEVYRTALKKQRLRIVPASIRLIVLRDILQLLLQNPNTPWRELQDSLAYKYSNSGRDISKNQINAAMLAARQADVIQTQKADSLAAAPVKLNISGPRIFQEALLLCDRAYLQAILNLPVRFDLEEAALALYAKSGYKKYLQQILNSLENPPEIVL